VLVLFCAAGLAAGRHSSFGERFFPYLPLYLTYTSNWAADRSTPFGYSWSLACEEQFYLLWPPVLVLLGTRGATASLVGLLVAKQAAEHGWLDSILPRTSFLSQLLCSVQPSIALGVLLAVALHSPRGHAVLARILGSRFSSLVALLLVAVVLSVPDAPYWYFATGLAMALVVGACVIPARHVLTVPLNFRPIARLGVVSYAMYLFHLPLITAMRRVISLPPPVLFIAAALVTWAAAEASFATFERYFRRLKARYER
jgi:peptidoglycan/LPS O-acetylase OafA/YrhL